MPLLIDGHNLIGKIPGLSLEDPEDEAELVHRLRHYCWRRHRRATVVFDAGLPGGRSSTLSNPQVNVIFATSGVTADAIIRHRLRRARDPRGLIVVSSDRAIQAAARQRGARVVPAEEFAGRLSPRSTQTQGMKEHVLSEDEVMEWLELFESRE